MGLPYAVWMNFPHSEIDDGAPAGEDTAWVDALHRVQETVLPSSPTALTAIIEASWGSAIQAITGVATRAVAELGFFKIIRVPALLSCFQIDLTGFREMVGAPSDDALSVSTTATKAMVLLREEKAPVAFLQLQMDVMLKGAARSAEEDRLRTLEMKELRGAAAEYERQALAA